MSKSNNISMGILGLGNSVPERVLTNSELEKMVNTSDEWIVRRTGISERRLLSPDQKASDLGTEAAKKALKDAGISAEQIDLIIVSTETPDYLTPSTSCIIQKNIGAINAAAFDVNAACSGFVYGLTIADQFVKTGYYKYILVIGCEGLSRVVDWEDRNTCVLFGDGAGAAVLGPVDEGYGVIQTSIGAVGSLGDNITLPCCYISKEDEELRIHDNKHVLWMDGGVVLKFAVKAMSSATTDVLEKAGLSVDDLKIIVPHQANVRIIDGAAKRLGISPDKVYKNIHKYGNISSACVPVALTEIKEQGLLNKDDYLVVVGFGGGLTWASALIKWY